MNPNEENSISPPKIEDENPKIYTCPNFDEDRASKANTFSKKINSQTEGLSPTKVSGLGHLRQTAIEMNKKYQIFWIHPKEGAEIKEISVVFDLPEVCTVEDCIILGLKELNKILELKQKGYCLAENPKLYELFIAKKNGRPKEDYPSYDYELLVKSTQNYNFCLVPRTEEALVATKEKSLKASMHDGPKKTVKFLEKEESKKPPREIILLPDEDENPPARSSFLNLFCFCWSHDNNKKKLLKNQTITKK